MKVLIACEFSGVVRDAFRRRGHDAMSCDLLETESPGPHYRGDVRDLLGEEWDLMVAHPPCTHLARSGGRWFMGKESRQDEALGFVLELMSCGIGMWAIENPVGLISTRIRKPDQIVQPWQFGHGETKATCLWLHRLKRLESTKVVEGREGRIANLSPRPDRWKERSRTYVGVAEAMADQWGSIYMEAVPNKMQMRMDFGECEGRSCRQVRGDRAAR